MPSRPRLQTPGFFIAGALLLAMFALATLVALMVPRINAGIAGESTGTSTASDNIGPLRGISAHAEDDVWVVGQTLDRPSKALAMHWNGKEWTRTNLPSPDTLQCTNTYFNDVFAVSQDDVWAVGGMDLVGHTDAMPGKTSLVAHWDGKSWNIVPNLALGTQVGPLAAVDGSGPNDIWVVGGDSALHWNGGTWTEIPTQVSPGAWFVSVDAVSPTNAWAVGGSNILRWDGTSWKQTYTREKQGGDGDRVVVPEFRDIAMQSETDGWVLGTNNLLKNGQPWSIDAMHWNGTTWETSDKMDSGVNTYNLCTSIQTEGPGCGVGRLLALSANDVWAVGGYNFSMVSHWDGSAWEEDTCAMAEPAGSTDESYMLSPREFGGALHDVAQVGDALWAVGISLDGGGSVLDINQGPCTSTERPRPTRTAKPEPPAEISPLPHETAPMSIPTVPMPVPSGVVPSPVPSYVLPDPTIIGAPRP